MLDQAFDALKTYNWGAETKALQPIEEAVVATHGDAAARKELETRLIAVLTGDVSRDAKDYVCRKLRVVGTAQSVPALAAMLDQDDHAHMARYALERIPAPEAARAMRDALPTLKGELKIGVISSLGARQDTASGSALAALLGDSDEAVARSAALALGAIQAPGTAQKLLAATTRNSAVAVAATDAALACAEALLEAGKKADALAVYKGLAGADRPKHVRLAATRGMLACAGKSN